MEHDTDRIISLKITTAEKTPVHWQKGEVWRRIQSASERPLWRWRYAAAIICFLCSLGIYFFYRRGQEGVRNELIPLQEVVHLPVKEGASVRQMENNAVPVLPTNTGVASSAILERLEGEYAVHADTLIVADLPQEIVAYSNAPFAGISESAVRADTVTEPVIQAIIGVIPTGHAGVRISKAKKVKFRLLRMNEFPAREGNTEADQTITARIN